MATEAGAEVLRSGGNAVDAAATVQCALGVVEPPASGLGGGAFWLIYAAEAERVYALDARETAPAAATPDIFLGSDGLPIDDNDRAASGLAVAVPGALLGLEEVLHQLGTIGLARALEPAIRAAHEGVPVSAFMTSRIGLGSLNNRARLSKSAAAAQIFLPGGAPLKEGDLLVQRDLGRTLETLAERGSGELYRGTLGKAIVDEVRARGGRMTLDDLSAYRTVWREPLRRPFGQDEIVTFGPPGSGVSLLSMLSMLETLRAQHTWTDDVDDAHFFVETMRAGFADRATLGDPAHVHVPITGLLDPGYIAERCALIQSDRARERWPEGNPWAYEPRRRMTPPASGPQVGGGPGQTTHFTTADRWGNVVAVTATIESLFGSGIMVPGVGILLNNQMSDFDERPGGHNQVRPGARPLSSMAPSMVMRDGRPRLTLGSPGGTTIVPTIVQVMRRVEEAGLSLEEAIAAPRLYAGPGRRVTWEEGTDPGLLEALRERGHEVAPDARTIGNVQSIMVDWSIGNLTAVADPRRQGPTAQEGEA
jgi:gamma-glutamyltranspeptidase/glutathione hydrolase